ncbi:hypothetical protein FOB51_06675 [Paracoccus yeei]|uniref:Uncharacterized protein n=1 Tax=Paracoccus yeei TaxID=147645 RepID=A0A5P2QQ08_9RHOB|nr:hypothetical protein FOB51_06675 [Paracoccus yeei]
MPPGSSAKAPEWGFFIQPFWGDYGQHSQSEAPKDICAQKKPWDRRAGGRGARAAAALVLGPGLFHSGGGDGPTITVKRAGRPGRTRIVSWPGSIFSPQASWKSSGPSP